MTHLRLIAPTSLSLLIAACGGGKPNTTDLSQPAEIKTFALDRKEITAGESAKLKVEYVQGIGELTIDPPDPAHKDKVSPKSSDEFTFSPLITTNYTLKVNGTNASPDRTITLTVYPKPDATITAPESVAPEQKECLASVPAQAGTFEWSLENATLAEGQGTRQIKFAALNEGVISIGCKIKNPAGTEDSKTTTVSVRDNGLVLSIVGAPSDCTPKVTLIGPDETKTPLSGSQTFTQLKPGRYRVEADSFTRHGLNYHPWRPKQEIEVKAGEKTPLAVQYPLPLYVAMIPNVALPEKPTRLVPMEFVLIPAGKFDMGSDTTEHTRPVKTIQMETAFYMARTECTQAQWNILGCVNNAPLKGDDLPIHNVCWNEVRGTGGYLDLLNQHLPGKGFALPSEAQWEYAYRTGRPGNFPFADSELKQYMWFGDNSGGIIQPVATTNLNGKPEEKPLAEVKANPWGLCDMGGNAWEFVEDQYHASHKGAHEDGSPWKDPKGDTELRVFKGGYYESQSIDCTTWARSAAAPNLAMPRYGFRLIMTEPQFAFEGVIGNQGEQRQWMLGDLHPVDPHKTYRVTAQSLAWPKAPGAVGYIGLAEYDDNKNLLWVSNRVFHQKELPDKTLISSTTELAEDLNPNSTQVRLVNIEGFENKPEGWRRGFIFWDWKDKQGNLYQPGTYSPHVFSEGAIPNDPNLNPVYAYNLKSGVSPWADGNPINTETKTIQLKGTWSLYSNQSFPKGTRVSQASSGHGHRYCAACFENLPSRWTTYTGTIGGVGKPNTNDMHQFTPATRFVKLFFLAGYPKKIGEHVYFCNWKLEAVN